MEQKPAGILIGYARVSTEDQDLSLQLDALTKAGVSPTRIYKEKASGADDERPAPASQPGAQPLVPAGRAVDQADGALGLGGWRGEGGEEVGHAAILRAGLSRFARSSAAAGGGDTLLPISLTIAVLPIGVPSGRVQR